MSMTTEVLRVSNTGEFLWHKDADAMIANPGPDADPAMMHRFRALRRAEAVQAENERLREAMRSAMAMLDKHEPEPAGAFAVLLLALNPELQSAKNALRRDAKRYRWLRNEHSRIDPCIKANAKYRLERDSSTWVNIHDLDAAIDAAMKEDKT